MKENQIQELKNEGMKQRLWGEADSCVWEARPQLESAKKEDWRDAEKCFRLVRTLVDDAEQCLTGSKENFVAPTQGGSMGVRHEDLYEIDDEIMVRCDCHCHALQFTVYKDKSMPDKELYVSWWQYGQGDVMGFRNRLFSAWRLLWEGKDHDDEITFHDKVNSDLPRLVKFLRKHFERPVVSLPSMQTSSANTTPWQLVDIKADGTNWTEVTIPLKKKAPRKKNVTKKRNKKR